MFEPDFPLTLMDAALRGTLLALLLLLAAVMWRDRAGLPAARAGVLMALGLCVQVFAALPFIDAHVPRLWLAPMVAVSVGNGVLFWIFAQALFDDGFVWRPVHGLAWLGAAGLSALNCALGAKGLGGFATLAIGAQRALPLLFAGLAAMAAAAHWRADLVEGRRRLRAFVVGAGIAYTLLMLGLRLSSPQGRLSNLDATLDVLALLAIVAVLAWQLLRIGPSDIFPGAVVADSQSDVTASEPPPAPNALPPPDPAEERLAAALQRAMTADRVYRSEDLTVARLAARLGVPEYRLRRLINRRLCHRNFNAFVNAYRLDDARAALADTTRREVPVLTIALDAGFQSIGPFNRAFKAATGLTPSEYRRQSLADS